MPLLPTLKRQGQETLEEYLLRLGAKELVRDGNKQKIAFRERLQLVDTLEIARMFHQSQWEVIEMMQEIEVRSS